MATSQFIGAEGPFPDTPTSAVSEFRLLDAYVGLNLSNWQITFGQQSLWWGPGEGGSMLMSNNAAPMPMLRINRVTPFTLPLISKFLGPMRIELFFGQLSGQNFVNGPTGIIGSYAEPLIDQPIINGQKISFKPTTNFEFSFSRTGLIGGPGVPVTLGTFRHSILASNSGLPGTPQDPGDRRSAVDWTYRLPKLRHWLTFYGDAFADDQISPIAYWDRSAISAGLYLSPFPTAQTFSFAQADRLRASQLGRDSAMNSRTRGRQPAPDLQDDEFIVIPDDRGPAAQKGVKTVANLQLLWGYRRTIAKVVLYGFLVTTVIAFLIPMRYESVARLMPPDNNQAASGLAAVAAMVSSGSSSGSRSSSGGGGGGLGRAVLGLKSTSEIFAGILSSRTVEDELIREFNLRKVYWDR